MDAELSAYLAEKGWQWKESAGQIKLLSACPFCDKPGHVFFDPDTTVWFCQRCSEKGNLLTLRRRLGDLEDKIRAAGFYLGARDAPKKRDDEKRPPEGTVERCRSALAKSDRAMSYLRDARGFTAETIDRFKLGAVVKGDTTFVSIPHFESGQCVNVKFRSVPPAEKTFRRIAGCPTVLFNGDALRKLPRKSARERVVWLCEGETDVIALVQMLGGEPFVVGSTAGAGSFKEEWLALLEPATTILLAYDDDEAGELGADKAAATLGRWRCRRVRPSLHDWAEMLAAGMGRAEVEKCYRAAFDYETSGLGTINDFAGELRGRVLGPQPKGTPTGWLSLDALLGGWRDGEFTVITGDTGSGKSTWTTGAAFYQLSQGVPVLLAPFEQKPWEVVSKLVSVEAERSVFDMTEDQLDEAVMRVSRLPLYILDKHGPTPLSEIRDAVFTSVHRYGVKFVIIDHLHYFLACDPGNERYAIDEAVRAIKLWSQELQIHILLVVHPAKLGRDAKGNVRKVELDDLKGSSEIKKECDNGVRVWKERDEREECDKSEIAILKCRSNAGREGRVWFYFDVKSERYVEGAMPPEKRGRRRRRSENEPAYSGRDAAAGPDDDRYDDAF